MVSKSSLGCRGVGIVTHGLGFFVVIHIEMRTGSRIYT